MKHAILASILVLAASAAHADGFVCTSEEGLNVKVFNHVDAADGTRVGSVMIVSDDTIGAGNKTIARFSSENGTLSSDGATYTASVDLRFNDSGRKGELIAGTKLGELDTIVLAVDHNYSQPVALGTQVPAKLELTKRNGTVISMDLNCARYLKQ